VGRVDDYADADGSFDRRHPLQMHMAMGVIASGGNLLQPQIIQQIRDATGEVVYRYGPLSKHRAISEATAHTMASMLMGVASSEGTAPSAAIPIMRSREKRARHRRSSMAATPSGIMWLPSSGSSRRAGQELRFRSSWTMLTRMHRAAWPIGTAVAAPSFKHIGEQLIQYLDIKPVYTTAGSEAIVMGGVR